MAFLEVRNLDTTFSMPGDIVVHAVKWSQLQLGEGTGLRALGRVRFGQECDFTLHPSCAAPEAHHRLREVWLDGVELLSLPEAEMRDMRGSKISMIFQEPIAAFDPIFTVASRSRRQ